MRSSSGSSADDNSVISEGEILHFDKGDDRLEVIGLSFDEAKAVLAGIQGARGHRPGGKFSGAASVL